MDTFWKVVVNNLLAFVAFVAVSTVGVVIVLGTSIGYEGDPVLFLASRYVICLALYLLAGRILLRPIEKANALLSFVLTVLVIIVNALLLVAAAMRSIDGFLSGGIYLWWVNFWYSATAALFFNIDIYDALHGGTYYPVRLWFAAIFVAATGPALFMYLGLRLKMWKQGKKPTLRKKIGIDNGEIGEDVQNMDALPRRGGKVKGSDD